jgi:glycosyltransferase involved in cell wall biosynthesis
MKKMKKILLFPDFASFGGTRTYFENLIDFYRSEGYHIVTAIDEVICNKEIQEFLAKNEVKIISMSAKYRKGIFAKFFFSIFIDLLLGIPIIVQEKPNIVVVSTGTTGKFLGLMLLFSTKFIYIVHSYPICDGKRIIYRNPFYRLLLVFSFNRQKRILTVSKFSQNQITKCWFGGREQNRIHFIHNFSNLEKDSDNSSIIIKNDTKKVLTLGHVIYYKNPSVWYTVAQKTIEKFQGDVEFLWAGEGELLDKYRDKAKQDNIPQIKFLGYQNNVKKLYNQSIIYFQPSLIESHGISVVDAMMMGLPCIVSKAGGLPESIIHGKTGYIIDPNDVDKMVEKLLELLGNENLRQSMGMAGKESYLNNFSHQIWREKMKKFHDTLK